MRREPAFWEIHLVMQAVPGTTYEMARVELIAEECGIEDAIINLRAYIAEQATN